MCKIKTGEEITQMNDVQNLVTAYILGSEMPYTAPKISMDIIRLCEGSKLNITEEQIANIVEDTMLALKREKYIFSNSGNYYTCPV